MKKLVLFGIFLTFIFIFSFTLTMELYAFEENPILEPEPPLLGGNCCTYTTWCGSVGSGSLVPVKYYDVNGKPYWVLECRFLQPSSPYYNFKCNYECAPNCNAD